MLGNSKAVTKAAEARTLAGQWLIQQRLGQLTIPGPEFYERGNFWVCILQWQGIPVGEVAIEADSGTILEKKTTTPNLIQQRKARVEGKPGNIKTFTHYTPGKLENVIACGDARKLVAQLPASSIDLIFTSPPYYNARPEYREYLDCQQPPAKG